jgi:hypothetical protein
MHSQLPTATTACQVPLSSICVDAGSQARVKIHAPVVREYAEAMSRQREEGQLRFPPVVLFSDTRTYWIGDGFHRVLAAQKAGLSEILAEVRNGTQRDALLHSLSANSSHGLPRSNADKRRAVSLLLADADWSQWSDVEIAGRCQVSDRFVGTMRRRASSNGSRMRPRKVRRGGVVYEMSVPARNNPPTEYAGEILAQAPHAADVSPAVDAVGIPLSEPMAGVFTARADFQAAKTLYAQLAELIDRLARGPGGEVLAEQLQRDNEAGFEKFRCTDLEASLHKLVEAEPYCSRCPDCYLAHPGWNNPECKACQGRGWLTCGAFESCPEDYRRQAMGSPIAS